MDITLTWALTLTCDPGIDISGFQSVGAVGEVGGGWWNVML